MRTFFVVYTFALLMVALATYLVGRRRVARSLVALAMAGLCGVVLGGLRVNMVGQFAQSWGQAWSLVVGSDDGGKPTVLPKPPAQFGAEYKANFENADAYVEDEQPMRGEYRRAEWTGPQSGVSQSVVVWLPPGWQNEKDLRVIEFLHGVPGSNAPSAAALKMDAAMADAIESGQLPPTMVVLPNLSVDDAEPDCIDLAGRPKVGTWTARDVPGLIRANFPVSAKPDHWTIAGVSSGAYCAGVLGTQAADVFGSEMLFSGYDEPVVGGLKSEPENIKKEFSVSTQMAKLAEPNVFATASGEDEDAIELLDRLGALKVKKGSVVLPYTQDGVHGWVQWVKEYPQAVQWLGKVADGTATSHDAKINEGGILDGMVPIYALWLLAAGGFGGAFYWRMKQTVSHGVLARGVDAAVVLYGTALLMVGAFLLFNLSTNSLGSIHDFSNVMRLFGLGQ